MSIELYKAKDESGKMVPACLDCIADGKAAPSGPLAYVAQKCAWCGRRVVAKYIAKDSAGDDPTFDKTYDVCGPIRYEGKESPFGIGPGWHADCRVVGKEEHGWHAGFFKEDAWRFDWE